MQMSIDNQLIILSTLALVKELDGPDRTDFIENIWEHYDHALFMRYPNRERKRYYELLSELVKNFGH